MRSSAVLIHTQRCTKWEIGRLQEGLLKKEGSRINASRLSDVLLLKNLAAGGESCTQNLLKQVIKECSLREEARITREEQMAASQGKIVYVDHERGVQQMRVYMQECISSALRIHETSREAKQDWPQIPIFDIHDERARPPAKSWTEAAEQQHAHHNEQHCQGKERSGVTREPMFGTEPTAHTASTKTRRVGEMVDALKRGKSLECQQHLASWGHTCMPEPQQQGGGAADCNSTGFRKQLDEACEALAAFRGLMPVAEPSNALVPDNKRRQWRLALISASSAARKLQRAWRWHRKRSASRAAVVCGTVVSSTGHLHLNKDVHRLGHVGHPTPPCMHVDMHRAASTIQAATRGWLARRRVACMQRHAALSSRRKRAARWGVLAKSAQKCENDMRRVLTIWMAAEGVRTQLQLKAQDTWDKFESGWRQYTAQRRCAALQQPLSRGWTTLLQPCPTSGTNRTMQKDCNSPHGDLRPGEPGVLPGVRVVFCDKRDRSIHTVHPALAALREELVREYAEAAETMATRVQHMVAEGGSMMAEAEAMMTQVLFQTPSHQA